MNVRDCHEYASSKDRYEMSLIKKIFVSIFNLFIATVADTEEDMRNVVFSDAEQQDEQNIIKGCLGER